MYHVFLTLLQSEIMSKRYAFNDGSEDFIVEVDDIHHARETAELYNAQITGIMYDPYGEVNFKEDKEYNWKEK